MVVNEFANFRWENTIECYLILWYNSILFITTKEASSFFTKKVMYTGIVQTTGTLLFFSNKWVAKFQFIAKYNYFNTIWSIYFIQSIYEVDQLHNRY